MAPSSIGRYTIIRPLGAGGMADVYLARDPQLNREVALKMPALERPSPDALARFRVEARAVARLEHAAIVPLYEYGDHAGRPFLVMRYMHGGSLADRIDQRRATLAEAVAVVDQIAAALDYAHAQGVIHRDVKPGNILFDDAGAAYLTDFGIARMIDAGGGKSLTQTGLIVGTVAYMSPEQALGRPNLDGRVDIYSLGVVLYEMLTGDIPYQADSQLQQAMLHVNAPIPSIRERRRDLPPGIQAVIERALADAGVAGGWRSLPNAIIPNTTATTATAAIISHIGNPRDCSLAGWGARAMACPAAARRKSCLLYTSRCV